MTPLFLPYYPQPHWDIPFPIVGHLTIHAFGVLVALALVVGTWLARWHGRQLGQDPVDVVDCATWTAIWGFVVAHIVSVVFYFPHRLIENPLNLIYFWNGLSSFGGFIGGVFGCIWFCRRRKLRVLAYVDSIFVGLSGGWILGRLGCTIAHDHPGRPTDFPLAFAGPGHPPAHDLGFYEFLFAICLFVFVMIVRKRNWPHGTIPALAMMIYAPVRFFFDTLRIEDVRYGGLTPGQWLAIGLFAGGAALLWWARKQDLRPQWVQGPRQTEQGHDSRKKKGHSKGSTKD